MDQAKTDNTIATSYSNLVTALEKAEVTVTALKRELRNQAEVVANAAQERSREQEQELYRLETERRRIVDEYNRQDAERIARIQARENALQELEVELSGIFGVPVSGEGVANVKAFKQALDARVAAAEKTAEGRGRGIAEAVYATQKRLDDAALATKTALLEQENKQLMQLNAQLAKANNDLMTQQAATTQQMKEISLGALTASAGITGKANEAMQTAVAAGAAGGMRR